MKKLLGVLGLLLLVSCTNGVKTTGGTAEQDSLAKLKTFEDGIVQVTAEQTKGRDVKIKVLERAFFDNYLLAVVHFHVTEEPGDANPQGMSGHIFFILGRMKTDAEWIPMNNFSRMDPPPALSGGEGEKL